MANETKPKPQTRVAGASKFRLPERPQRIVESNPMRDILDEAKAQEVENLSVIDTPVRNIAVVSRLIPVESNKIVEKDTPARNVAGVSPTARKKVVTLEVKNKEFEDFRKRWSPLLRAGQMKVCEALYLLTYAEGKEDCFTSMPKLATIAGLKERQCYNIVAQLEALRFIERPEVYNTPMKKGTVFRFYLNPQFSETEAKRRYHIGSDVYEKNDKDRFGK